MKKIGLTGRIGKPLITLDVLLPIGRDSDVYARMVRQAGRSPLHRYYRIKGGTHTDAWSTCSRTDCVHSRRATVRPSRPWRAGSDQDTGHPPPRPSPCPPAVTPQSSRTPARSAFGSASLLGDEGVRGSPSAST
jgi:hypothetical protein